MLRSRQGLVVRCKLLLRFDLRVNKRPSGRQTLRAIGNGDRHARRHTQVGKVGVAT